MIATLIIVFLNLVPAQLSFPSEENLIALVQIFRHGERTPASFYKNDPWKNILVETLGEGQLTQEGKRMHFKLGQFTRQRYGDILPRLYSEKWFRAYSTDVDRTLMSCQANLAGLFWPNLEETWHPSLPWQPIPIHHIPPEILTVDIKCPAFNAKLKEIWRNNPVIQSINAKYSDVYDYLSRNIGSNFTFGREAALLYNTLRSEELLGLELPAWTKLVYPEPIQFLGLSSLKSLTSTEDLKRLAIGPWLNEVINMFTDTLADPSSIQPKFRMYSAHDFNMAAALNTLENSKTFHWPAYASTLYFELWNKTGSPTLNIFYKDDDQRIFRLMDIRGCGYTCSLDNFKKAMNKYVVDVETWKEECNSLQNKEAI